MCVAGGVRHAYSYFHSFTSDEFHAAHNILFHFDKLRELLGKIRAESTSSLSAENMAWARKVSVGASSVIYEGLIYIASNEPVILKILCDPDARQILSFAAGEPFLQSIR